MEWGNKWQHTAEATKNLKKNIPNGSEKRATHFNIFCRWTQSSKNQRVYAKSFCYMLDKSGEQWHVLNAHNPVMTTDFWGEASFFLKCSRPPFPGWAGYGCVRSTRSSRKWRKQKGTAFRPHTWFCLKSATARSTSNLRAIKNLTAVEVSTGLDPPDARSTLTWNRNAAIA